MSIQTRQFVFAEIVNGYFFGPRGGWRMADRPHFDPCHSPHVVCHDVYEHHEDDKDAIEDEMMAFGAAFMFRCGERMWKQYHSRDYMLETLYTDFYNFLEQREWKVEPCDEPLPHDPVLRALVRDFHRYCYTSIRRGLSTHDWRNDTWTFNEAKQEEFEKKMGAIQDALIWSFRGWNRAQARYGKHSNIELIRFMELNMIAIESQGRGVDFGDTLTVTFDTDKLEAEIVVKAAPKVGTRYDDRDGFIRSLRVARDPIFPTNFDMVDEKTITIPLEQTLAAIAA